MSKISLENSFASHEKAIYWSDRNDKKPDNFSLGSRQKVYFKCDCGHEFLHTISSIVNGSWCPYCCENSKKVCGLEECKKCFQKSFASHEKAKFWSSKNQKKSFEYMLFSNVKVWFKCSCNHDFEALLSSITNGNWCPYCSNFARKLCGDINCKLCFEKSFASNEKSKYWSDKNKISPINCAKNSHEKYLFNCNKCMHEFSVSLNFINNGGWCSYCYGVKICFDDNCQLCFDKSFASHEKAKFWCGSNKLKPREVIKGSRGKYKFICEKGHSFETKLCFIIKGSWCSKCINKTELKLFTELSTIYNDMIYQFKADWCKNDDTLRCFPFDYALIDKNIIIELDGRQHFIQVKNWENPTTIQSRDKYKMNKANESGFSVIRLLQEDVYKNKYDWMNEIKITIEKIISENKIQNIFLCKNNEYNVYQDN